MRAALSVSVNCMRQRSSRNIGERGGAMSKFGKDLVQGLTEAVEFARGNKAEARVHVVEVPDVRAIRRQLHMSQHECGSACNFDPLLGVIGVEN